MQAAGIRVRLGILEEQAEKLNKRFLTFHRRGRPYIILKWASAADGMMAGRGPSRVAISGNATRALVHQWRYEEAGIMVGAGTVSVDDPRLTVRPLPSPRQPVRIILDPHLRLHPYFHVFDQEAPGIICNTLRDGSEGHLRYLRLLPAEDLVPEMLHRLHEIGIQSVLVEGGRKLLEAFLKADAWDEIRRIKATDKIMPDGYPEPDWGGLSPASTLVIGKDIIETFNHG
jgi:diaminohydroxyphosphoribosylaminopyrimidine deaminase/5-amino-6-(5-phosphoribosylamino)uracil reductase